MNMTIEGKGYFSFQLPNNVTVNDSVSVSFIIRYKSLFQALTSSVNIESPNFITVDFYSETGIMVPSVDNKIYFEVYTNPTRDTPLNI